MDQRLKTTIDRKLDEFSDEHARQLLDYMEFLESKSNRSTRDRSAFEKLADNVEGTIRASSIGGAAIKGTSQVLEAAGELMRGVVSAGRAVVDELQRLEQEAEAAAANKERGTESSEATASPSVDTAEAEAPNADGVEPAEDNGGEDEMPA
jgi:hypothetical protein